VYPDIATSASRSFSIICSGVNCFLLIALPPFNVLLVCEEMNLLGGTMFALDGCKLPSNASKEWSGTFHELHKKKQKIEAQVAQLLADQIQTDRGPDESPEGPGQPALNGSSWWSCKRRRS
jgi:hypothetical protein